MMVFASYSEVVLIDMGEWNLFLTFAAKLLGLMFYGAIFFVAGRAQRLVRGLTAIIGCGAVLTFLFVAEFVLFSPFLGAGLAWLIAALIILWSLPVEGHIIARVIGQHWFVGIAIAVAAFFLQLGLLSVLSERS